MSIETDYDTIKKTELEKRLKRPATDNELNNSETDSDLVNETLWQLLLELEKRITALESNKKT